MASIQLSDVTQGFGPRQLFRGVNLTLAKGDRTALTGANGSGKTTLIKILSRAMIPDSGRVVYSRQSTVSYLPQSGVVLGSRTVYEEAERAYERFLSIIESLKEYEDELSRQTEESNRSRQLLIAHSRLQQQLEEGGYNRRKRDIGKVLTGLGFHPGEYGMPSDSFSSGWQMRIALSRILLEQSDFLLMDEPTNYLDLEARVWLADYLNHSGKGVLVVSHDRSFLDETVKKVFEIDEETVKMYRGNFSGYEAFKEQKREVAKRRYEEYVEEKDGELLEGDDDSYVILKPGTFAVFFTQDGHKPGCKVRDGEDEAEVTKVVLKARI